MGGINGHTEGHNQKTAAEFMLIRNRETKSLSASACPLALPSGRAYREQWLPEKGSGQLQRKASTTSAVAHLSSGRAFVVSVAQTTEGTIYGVIIHTAKNNFGNTGYPVHFQIFTPIVSRVYRV